VLKVCRVFKASLVAKAQPVRKELRELPALKARRVFRASKVTLELKELKAFKVFRADRVSLVQELKVRLAHKAARELRELPVPVRKVPQVLKALPAQRELKVHQAVLVLKVRQAQLAQVHKVHQVAQELRELPEQLGRELTKH
jgi:hypothetical protein